MQHSFWPLNIRSDTTFHFDRSCQSSGSQTLVNFSRYTASVVLGEVLSSRKHLSIRGQWIKSQPTTIGVLFSIFEIYRYRFYFRYSLKYIFFFYVSIYSLSWQRVRPHVSRKQVCGVRRLQRSLLFTLSPLLGTFEFTRHIIYVWRNDCFGLTLISVCSLKQRGAFILCWGIFSSKSLLYFYHFTLQ